MAITQELIDKTETNLNRWDDIVNEDENGTTTLDNAVVKSLAGYLAEFKSYNILGAWQTGYSYSIKDVAKESGNHYICLEAHTSGTFSTDLSSGKWGLFQVDFSNLTATGTFTGTFTGDLTGSILQASQTNITAVGTLTSLTVSGDVTVDTSTLKVDSTNNRVGIGTTSPSSLMHLATSGGSTILTMQRTNTNTTGSIGDIIFNVSDNHTVAGIRALADGDNEGAHMLFGTTSTASGNGFSTITEQMRIASTGLITGDFNDTSDICLKKNVRDFEITGLEILKGIKARIFDWKNEEKGNNIFGFIAQELEEVMPTAVIQGDIKSINVTSIASVLVHSVQELAKKVEELEKQIKK